MIGEKVHWKKKALFYYFSSKRLGLTVAAQRHPKPSANVRIDHIIVTDASRISSMLDNHTLSLKKKKMKLNQIDCSAFWNDFHSQGLSHPEKPCAYLSTLMLPTGLSKWSNWRSNRNSFLSGPFYLIKLLFIAQWLERPTGNRKTRVRSPAGLRCVFSSDPAVRSHLSDRKRKKFEMIKLEVLAE